MRSLYQDVKDNQDFIKAIINKKFTVENTDDWNLLYENYFCLWQYIELTSGNYGLKSAVLLNLLILSNYIEKYDESVLLDYMKYHRFSHIYKDNVRDYNKVVTPFQYLIIENIEEKELLMTQFEHIFKDRTSSQPYDNYIVKEFIDEMFSLTKIYSGNDPHLYNGLLSPRKLKEISESSDLELLKSNPTSFSSDVKLNLVIRNIQKLLIKIYYINSIAYYLNKNTEFTPEIDLDGLVANQEIWFYYNQTQLIKHREEFNFESLKNQRGTYIIDFIGNGKQTRALINLGQLRYVEKLNEIGHEIYIFDEYNQACNDTKSGIYIDNQFYSANQNGFSLIPYAYEQRNKKMIITDGKLGKLIENFVHLQAKFEIKAYYYVYEEQILANKNAAIQISPSLFINGYKAKMNLLDEFEITVSLTNIDGLRSSKSFIEPSSKEHLSLSLQIPQKISQIDISLSSKLKENSEIRLSHKYSKVLNSHSPDSLCQIYLKKNNDDFVLELRGRDGEIWKNQVLDLNIMIFYGNKSVKLASDSKGEIHLGSLEGVDYVSTWYSNQDYFWKISDFRERFAYPQQIYLNYGETLDLPVSKGYEDVRFLEKRSLIEVKNGIVREILDLEFNQNDSMVKIKGLKIGDYLLKLRPENTEIKIKVISGQIISRTLISDKISVSFSENHPISIKSTRIQNSQLNIDFTGITEGAKLEILFCDYLSDSIVDFFTDITSNQEAQPQEILFKTAENRYLNSRRMSDEIRYVLDRKNQTKYPGNNLNKPQLVLKRQLVQKTSSEEQEVYEGDDYQDMEMIEDQGWPAYEEDQDYDQKVHLRKTSLFYDFLDNPAVWKHETLTSESSYVIDLNSKYSQIILYISNEEYSSVKFMSTGENVITRSLVSSANLGDKNIYSEQIKVEVINKEKILNVQEVTAIEIVDNIKKLQNLQLEIAENDEYREWSFLSDWNKCTTSKKNDLYEKYFSHELNLFIFFKDQAYFQTSRDFISNRMVKDLIDKFLLNEDLTEYLPSFHKLNILEKVLLISWGLKQNSEKIVNDVRALARDIQNQIEAKDVDEENQYRTLLKVFQFSEVKGDQVKQSYSEDEYAEASMPYAEPYVSPAYENESNDFLDKKTRKSNDFRQPKKIIETTKEYTETYYYKPDNRIEVTQFWGDLLKEILGGHSAVLTKNAIFATSSLTELVFVLSVADLPFENEKLKSIRNANKLAISSETNALIFYKELTNTEIEIDSDLLISQRFITPENSGVANTQFLHKKIYESRIVISNTSDQDRQVFILLQIPDGSIPIANSFYTQTISRKIQAFSTEFFAYKFYFPYPGNFTFYPVIVSNNNKVVAHNNRKTYQVYEKFENIEHETFGDIVIRGNQKEILTYLNEKNLYATDFNVNLIYHKLKDQDFYTKAIQIFKNRKYYDEIVWLYSTLHNDFDTFYELLNRNE